MAGASKRAVGGTVKIKYHNDEESMSVLGLCSGWGWICGNLIANGELIRYWWSFVYHW